MAASNAPVLALAKNCVGSPAAFVAMTAYDAVTETFDAVDWFAYKAVSAPKSKGKKGMDPDYPTLAQVEASPDYEEWKESMDAELQVLKEMNTWIVVPRSEALNKGAHVIKSTWVHHQK